MAFIYCHNCGHKIPVSAIKHRAIGFGISAFGVFGWFSFLFAGSGHAFLIAAGITIFGVAWFCNAKESAKQEAIRERCPNCGSQSLYDYQKDKRLEVIPRKQEPSFEERLKMFNEVLQKHSRSHESSASSPSYQNRVAKTSQTTQAWRGNTPQTTRIAHPSRITINPYYNEYDYCPDCGSGHLVKRYSEHGAFLGCSQYPDCAFTHDSPEKCPSCGSGKLRKRFGKYGPFIGCSNFPRCRYTRDL